MSKTNNTKTRKFRVNFKLTNPVNGNFYFEDIAAQFYGYDAESRAYRFSTDKRAIVATIPSNDILSIHRLP